MKQVESSTAGRVLVVDDEMEMLKFLAEALPEFGYEITCSATAGEALEALKQKDFDLLLTDMKLPGMDGIELLRAALEIDPNLVGIVITAYASLETAVEAMRSGAFDYITKPFESAKLLSTLSRAMEVHRLRLENIHLREIMAIYHLAQAATFPLDDKAFLNQVTDAVLRQCQGDEVSIMLPTPDGRALHMAAAKGKHPEQFVGARVPVEEGIAGWVARNRQSVMLCGKVDDSRFKPINPRPDIHAALSMPMMAAGNFVGVINVNVIHNPRPFQPAAVKALTVMVGMLASILHGSRLFRDLSEAEEKYRSIFENTGTSTMIVEKDGTISLMNTETEEQSGYSKEELEGKRKWTEFVSEGDLERMREYHRVRRTDPEASPKHYEAKLIDKQGKVRDFYFTVDMIPDTGKSVVSMLDITSRKQAEAALQKSEEKYRSIFENAIEGIFQTTPEGKYLSVNPAFARMYGYDSPEELMEDIQDIQRQQYVNPGDRDRIIELFETQGFAERFEKQSRKKNGDTFWISITGRTVRDGDGHTLYYEGTVEDITERKKAEAALRESEERVKVKLNALLLPEGDIGTLELSDIIDIPAIRKLMDDFFQITNSPLYILDRNGKILVATGWQDICTKFHRVHPETCKNCIESDTILSMGVAPGTFKVYRCKNNMWDIVTPITVAGSHIGNLFMGQFFFEDESLDYDIFRSQARKYGFDEEEYIAALERVPRWSREAVDTVMNFYTNFAHMLATLSYGNIKLARTLTERNELLTTLRESEEKYRSIFENATEGIFQTTPDGEYLSANPALARMYGYDSPEEFMEAVKDVRRQQYVNPGDRDRLVELYETQGLVKGFETQLRKKNGDVVWVSITGRTVMGGDDQALFYEGTAIDINERKRAEAQRTVTEHKLRRQSERLRALSKKLAQIDETERHRLARELHDRVGGNLTALGINLNILKRQLPETIRPAVHSRLDDTLVLLAETVERVRDVMSDLRPSVLDDYGLVAALRWYSGQFSLRTGIKVTLVGEELEVRLESYVESALYRIAQEALTNVAKHARASSAEIKWELRERKVSLAISDDGVGFSHSAVREETVQGWGLLIMKERAKALVGGTCTIGPGPEGGTVVMVEVTI